MHSIRAALADLTADDARAELEAIAAARGAQLTWRSSAAAHAELFREVLDGDTAPRLSVVVCTHNRPADLERCLDALAALDERPEVIVVDSASEPPCRELVERYASDIPASYTSTKPTRASPGPGTAASPGRRGSIVAFVDDDAAPRRDWSREIVAPFARDPGIGCVGGACVAAFEDGAAQPPWLSDRLLQFAGITRFGDTARQARSSAEWPFGANIAFRASVLSDDPFPENLGRNGTTLLSGEEFALVASLRDAGWKIWLEPRAVVDHTVHRERCRSQLLLASALVGRCDARPRRGLTRAQRSPARGRRTRAPRSLRVDPRPRVPVPICRDGRIPRRAVATASERSMKRRPSLGALLALTLFRGRLSWCGRSSTTRRCSIPTATSTCSWPAGSSSTSSRRPCSAREATCSFPNADAAVKPLFPLAVAVVHAVGVPLVDAARSSPWLPRHGVVTAVALLVRALSGSTVAGLAAGTLVLASPSVAFWTRLLGPRSSRSCAGSQCGARPCHRRARLGGVLMGLAIATRPEIAAARPRRRRPRLAKRARSSPAATRRARDAPDGDPRVRGASHPCRRPRLEARLPRAGSADRTRARDARVTRAPSLRRHRVARRSWRSSCSIIRGRRLSGWTTGRCSSSRLSRS